MRLRPMPTPSPPALRCRAQITLLQSLAGESMWPALQQYMVGLSAEDRLSPQLFWFSFTVIVFFLLLNIFLSIVVDAFISVKDRSSESETLSESVRIDLHCRAELCRRYATRRWPKAAARLRGAPNRVVPEGDVLAAGSRGGAGAAQGGLVGERAGAGAAAAGGRGQPPRPGGEPRFDAQAAQAAQPKAGWKARRMSVPLGVVQHCMARLRAEGIPLRACRRTLQQAIDAERKHRLLKADATRHMHTVQQLRRELAEMRRAREEALGEREAAADLEADAVPSGQGRDGTAIGVVQRM